MLGFVKKVFFDYEYSEYVNSHNIQTMKFVSPEKIS